RRKPGHFFATLSSAAQPTSGRVESSKCKRCRRFTGMKRLLKWISIVVALFIVLILVLPFVINVNDFRPRIESELTNALGRKVTVGNLSLSLWSGSLAADNITIADDPSFSKSPFIQAQKLDVGVELVPLILSKTIHITNLTLTNPQV